MNEPLTSANFSWRAQSLFKAQQEIDTLLRAHVDELLNSHAHIDHRANTLQSVIESMNAALVVYNAQGKAILANRKAIAIIGKDPQCWTISQILKPYKVFKLDGTTPIPIEEYPSLIARTGKSHSIEAIVYGGDFPEDGVTLSLSASPIKNDLGNVIGVVSTFTDISENKRLERQRNTLAALIAHDMKNHLAAIGMTMSMLNSQLAASLDASMLTLISEIATNNRRFLDIANTLLELYRTDLYELESSRINVDIAEIVRDALAMNARESETAQVNVGLQVGEDIPAVSGIPAALRQAFHNLIQNAIEASTPGARIDIIVSGTATAVRVKIVDHGSGMSEEMLSKIFDRSRVASSVPTATSSTGFGLYLSRVILDAHRATVSCHSQLGQGTTFSVDLPVADS
ncbi:MAG TPA: ATP-binding protein [Candidatus Obscuribacterales bacterium]